MLAKLKKLDYTIILILLVFMVISSLLVHSADVSDPLINIPLKKQIIIYVMALIALVASSFFDYRILVRFSLYPYLITIVLLVYVWRTAEVINGSSGWIKITEDFSFQPAELMKLVLIIALAAWLHKKQGEDLLLIRDVIPMGLITLLPFGLVFVQPDLGNAVILIGILIGMYWIGNMKYSHALFALVVIGGALIVAIYFYSMYPWLFKHYLGEYLGFKKHWFDRVDTFLFPERANYNLRYQAENSLRAIGSGGLGGEGYLNGSSIHSNFIPYAYSDAIFVVVGEEFGFRGAAIMLMLYFFLIYRMILIAIQSRNRSGAYIIVGVVAMYVFQIFENVGMLIGLMPLTGITLPFVSYGGTSLLINMLCIGMVLSVKIYDEEGIKE
ncbi:FtsW/RodA/SpoVE family cell cycle protein [Paenibacillus sp. FJAT-26967]|uniref:FtsW/RodA/SpoVE family cell cycle protein n=1 Tax=Paenibacillus sp. FJAT-26967 TaxID=1729690 RepID=UPI000838CF08|nr:FtsW/RodA/SpoVE family cell cycle protein [Paenibacillus sp. FJAT-26967]